MVHACGTALLGEGGAPRIARYCHGMLDRSTQPFACRPGRVLCRVISANLLLPYCSIRSYMNLQLAGTPSMKLYDLLYYSFKDGIFDYPKSCI